MLAIFHGENRLEQEEAVAALLAELRVEDFGGMNKTVLESPLSLGQLRLACDTLPFLGDHRVVIVRGALTGENDAWAKEVAQYLPALPPSTHLLFVEPKGVALSHPILKAAKKLGAKVTQSELPKSKETAAWVWQRAQKLGLRLEPAAVALLASNLGSQVQLVDQELRKLQLYRGGEGVVTVEDVQVMMPYVAQAEVIFQMVDAIGQRKPQEAVMALHRLIDPGTKPEEYLGIFGMIVRQFRLLIQTRWLAEQRTTPQEITQRLGLHPFVGEKLSAQARQFTLAQLREAYRRLHETDLAMKTGQVPYPTALELLIAQLCRL